MNERVNEYFVYQHRCNTVKTVRAELCRLDRNAPKALTTAPNPPPQPHPKVIRIMYMVYPQPLCLLWAAVLTTIVSLSTIYTIRSVSVNDIKTTPMCWCYSQ